MTQWRKLLKSLGFSESEAIIYLTALELGPSPVQSLAKQSHVSRVTTYAVIESLSERGLMSWVEKGKKRLYTAESPERLVSFVSKRVQEMEATLREVEASLTDLKLIQQGEKPVVKIFEGMEGFKAIHDDILKTKPGVMYEMGDIDAIYAVFPPDTMKPYKDALEKHKLKTQAIMFSKHPMQARPSSNVRILPEKKNELLGDILIYDDKVALSTFHGKLISVLIENPEITRTLKELFRLGWENINTREQKK